MSRHTRETASRSCQAGYWPHRTLLLRQPLLRLHCNFLSAYRPSHKTQSMTPTLPIHLRSRLGKHQYYTNEILHHRRHDARSCSQTPHPRPIWLARCWEYGMGLFWDALECNDKSHHCTQRDPQSRSNRLPPTPDKHRHRIAAHRFRRQLTRRTCGS